MATPTSPSTPARAGRRARPTAAVAAAVSPGAARLLVRRSCVVYLGLVGLVAVVLLWVAAAGGDVARAVPFVAPLVVGEAVAALLQQLDRPRAATVLGLAAAAAATLMLTLVWDAALAVGAWGLFAGGAAALALLTCARIADEAVAWRRAPAAILRAAVDRVTFVPTSVVLALLGRTEGETPP